jgi:hypothetical protein
VSKKENLVNKLLSKNIIIVALARDCEKFINSDIYALKKATYFFNNVHWLIIESDSSDKTSELLHTLSNNISNFRFITLGNLSNKMPKRTSRIAHCRNKYLDEITNNVLYKGIDYVMVADIDGMNNKLTPDGLLSCWKRNDWDVCTANQAGPYYDIWALRHKEWCPGDCWSEFNFLQDKGLSYRDALFSAIHSRMITISEDEPWIEVDSAFGGLAVYKKKSLQNTVYIGLDKDGEEVCEHVHLHAQIKESGGSIFINPKLVNTDNSQHVSHIYFYQKIKLIIISFFKKRLN